MSVDLTAAERAYLIGLDWPHGALLMLQHMGGTLATGVCVDDLLDGDGPYLEEAE